MERNKMAITEKQVLENLQDLIGEEWNPDDVICCFEDCYGDELIHVNKLCNTEYDYTAYADEAESEQFYIKLDENGLIVDVR